LHKYLAILIAAIVAGHTLAALKHHYLDKNDILRRMLPNLKRKKNET
jgi:cytochrome b561